MGSPEWIWSRVLTLLDFDSKIAAQVLDFNPLEFTSRHIAETTDRYVHFGLASAKMAIDDSGLVLKSENAERFGICIGSVFGGAMIYQAKYDSRMQVSW